MNKIRSEEIKQAFIKYLEEHPQERFWQSVRNFSGFAFVLLADNLDSGETVDTFYFEELLK